MERVDNILHNRQFRELLDEIEKLEIDRIFCRHNMDHYVDVARLMVILAADEGISLERDIMYAAALLHDIGRRKQYTEGVRHEIASAGIAPSILRECGYSFKEVDMITEAITQHGNEEIKDCRDLKGILYRADKLSRKCYLCKAFDKCHKDPEKKVMSVI
ncbi:MAG: HD domain-containing protein [Lachnospiraceae bacterium]|nr:HD domain-containing protein [Lachnospiraceae bacterium]